MPLWTPSQITTTLWLDAADSSTLFDATSGGSAVAADGGVARWQDKSGNARHYTQTTSGNRPLRKTSIQNSKDVLRFDGTNDTLLRSDSAMFNINACSVYTVAMYRSTPATTQFILSSRTSGAEPLLYHVAASVSSTMSLLSYVGQTSGTLSFLHTAFPNTSAHLIGTVCNGTTHQAWLDGTSMGSSAQTGSGSPNNHAIGSLVLSGATSGVEFGAIDVCEILIVPSANSLETRQRIEGYLAWKWGIESNLPSDHPYRNAAPTAPNYKYPSLRTTLPVAGYYARLDAGTAATDQFTGDGSQDGTLTNGATRVDDGGLAYSFDGVNDHITLSPAILIPATSDWTLAFWVKPSVTTESTMLSQYTTGDGRLIVRIDAGNYKLFCGGGEGSFSIGSTAAVANTWAHIIVTRSVKTFTIYINNVSAGTRTDSGTRSLLQYRTLIGKRETDGTSENHFTGLIDDVVFYTGVVLDSTQRGYLASQRGAIYATVGGSSPINGQSLIRPADIRPAQLLIG